MSLVRQRFEINESTTVDCWIFVIRHADGTPDEFWFEGHVVAEFLGYVKPRNAIADNVSSEWRRNWQDLKDALSAGALATLSDDNVITPPNWQPHTVFITEPGLYELVTLSKNPEAVKFKKWVMEEVLPSLRRQGMYTVSRGMEPMDTSPARDVLLLQKDMEIQKLNYEKKLAEKEREIEKQRLLQESQARELKLLLENERLTMHYRYAFQTNSARELGRAAIEQYIQRKSAENAHKMIKTEITGKYRLIRNMDDINPLKVNHLSFVFDKRTDEYRVIRQQFGTTLKMYDCIQKTADSELEQLEPGKHKRRLNTDVYLVGEIITVAHGVNIWTNYLLLGRPCLFGLMFSTTSWNKFTIMDERALRAHYRIVQKSPRMQSEYSEKRFSFYKSLYESLQFTDEDDCVSKCLLVDIWQLRQQLLDYVQTHSFDFIETASVSEQQAITFEQLLNDSMDESTVDALKDVAQRFPEDMDTLHLRTVCERQRLIQPSSSIRNIQQLAIDSSSETAVQLEQQHQPRYTVQVPDTPQRPTDYEYADTMSITSVETQTPSLLTRYMNDLMGKRQTNVDKYPK